MIRERHSFNGLTLMLMLLCLGFGILFYWQWTTPLQADGGEGGREGGEIHAGEGNDEESPILTFVPPPLSAFSEIGERPLFTEGRLPPEKPVEEIPAQLTLAPLKLALEGVVITPDSRIAVISDLQSREVVRLAEGENHNDWRVERVEHDRVSIQRNGEEVVLELLQDIETNGGGHSLKPPFRLPLRRPLPIVPGQ